MNRGILFLAGVSVGVGLTLGVRSFHHATPPVPAVADPQAGHAAAVRPVANIEAQNAAAKADGLVTKIARLRRWADGKEPGLKRDGAVKILEEWSESDARTALAFVMNAPRFPERNEACAVPLAVICRHEAATVIAWILQNIVLTSDRQTIAEAIISRVEYGGPAVGLELAFALGIPADSGLFGELMGQLAQTQPQMAVQQFARMSPGGKKYALEPLLRAWSASSLDDALAWFGTLQERSPAAAITLIDACVKDGRYHVGDLIQQFGISEAERGELVARLSRSGFLFDATDLAFFSTDERREIAQGAVGNLAADADRVLRLLKTEVPADQQANVLFRGWREWLRSDRQAALDWQVHMPDRQLADELGRRLEKQELARHPEQALAALATIADPAERKEAATSAVQRLAREQPEVAAKWMSQNRAEPIAAEASEVVARSYLDHDEAAAMDWLAKLPASDAKDSALSAAIDYWGEKEVDFATASLAAIGNSEKRQAMTFRLYFQIKTKDSSTAEQWLEKQDVTPEVRQSWKALLTNLR